jgi:hypothetical protein
MAGNVVNTLSLPVVRLYSAGRAFVYSTANLPLNDYKQYMPMGSKNRQTQGPRGKCVSEHDISRTCRTIQDRLTLG